MMNNKSSARISKWIWRVQQLDFVVQHQAGKLAEVPDALSRQPLLDTNPYAQRDIDELYSGAECKPFAPLTKDSTLKVLPVATRRSGANTQTQVQAPVVVQEEQKVSEDKIEEVVEEKAECAILTHLEGWDLSVWLKEQSDEKNKQVFEQLQDYKKNKRGPYRINEDGLLVRVSKFVEGDTENVVERIFVPESLRHFVFVAHHNMPLGGAHMGRNRLSKTVGRRYYWPAMDEELRGRVRGCLGCAKRKTTRNMRLGLTGPVQASEPWDVVGIDLIGEFLETGRGNKYVLTMVDHFTKWPIAVCIPDRKAETIARAIY